MDEDTKAKVRDGATTVAKVALGAATGILPFVLAGELVKRCIGSVDKDLGKVGGALFSAHTGSSHKD